MPGPTCAETRTARDAVRDELTLAKADQMRRILEELGLDV
jgi:hypothetical protein